MLPPRVAATFDAFVELSERYVQRCEELRDRDTEVANEREACALLISEEIDDIMSEPAYLDRASANHSAYVQIATVLDRMRTAIRARGER